MTNSRYFKPLLLAVVLLCLHGLSALAAPTLEVSIPCRDKAIVMPAGSGNLLRAKGDGSNWQFALVPVDANVHILITKDWQFSATDGAGHTVDTAAAAADAGWGTVAGGGKELSLAWNSAPKAGTVAQAGTFTVTVSFKRWCGEGTGPGGGPGADIKEETLEWGGSVLGLEILDSAGNPITTKQTVCVGQKINLRTKILPNGLSDGATASYKWTIPTTTVSYYDVGFLGNHDAIQLDKKTIGFYWFNGGNSQTISVECTIGEEKLTDSVQFDVQAPNMDEFTSTTSKVDVGNLFGMGLELQTGEAIPNGVKPGIDWSAKVTAPALFSGKFKFTQIVHADIQRTKDDLVSSTESYKVPAWWSDLNDPVDKMTYAIAAGAQQTIHNAGTIDSPGWPLERNYKKLEVKFDKFQLYLMFQPDVGPNPIWIPIGKVAWGWTGVAESTDKGVHWTKTSGKFDADNPAGVAIIGTQNLDFPQYSDIITPGEKPKWVPDAQPNP